MIQKVSKPQLKITRSNFINIFRISSEIKEDNINANININTLGNNSESNNDDEASESFDDDDRLFFNSDKIE